ncbi:hypothetical protein SAMN05216201_11118 [Pseudomonas linyingensis]|uniref:Uncharacterized protein n=1 Tax=Pseudomonas linyingensis TaxID=915471 RepID=A0A1H7A6Y2_9PSED|nr:hypothetical protein [Pseudomonas linyingensis]SEJ56795.1 hypothetical protein SAMN05216201_11118 [Pseudomonas linyingensis]
MSDVKRYSLRPGMTMPATAALFLPDVVVSASDFDALQQRCRNLETVQQASMERSGRIKAAAGALGWTADRDDAALEFLIEQAQRCREMEEVAARWKEGYSDLAAKIGAVAVAKGGFCPNDPLILAIEWISDMADERDALRAENLRLAEWYSEAGVREDDLRAEVEELRKDKDLLDAIEVNCWGVRFSSSPNADAGDSSISIEIVGHYMAEPHERVVGENYHENLRAALCQAMTADNYPPARPEYDEDEAIDAAMEVAP